ncbi:thiol:disulfide interchange protein DsbA/DsbL [Luminiphilus sp. nBUS_16]|uniref:thiol:disulfide interchange protein DsbA/DsbL n=1 Tax=Luminiphilus sp. nBUS_16 TaxID=3395315 RepID=UPI003EB70218
MNTIRRNILVALVALLALPCLAWAETQWQEGEHYTVVNPAVRVGPTDQVIVTEFFWYGCGHCYTFEPMLQAWKKSLPEGSRLQPSPAAWNDGMKLHAKAYFTAETLDVLEPMHDAIFKAMHVERNRLGSKSAIRELFVSNGVAADDFDRAFDSFGVNSQVSQAEARARSAKISGTPSVLVNGKYLIEARKAGSQANMLKIAEFLVQQELANKS